MQRECTITEDTTVSSIITLKSFTAVNMEGFLNHSVEHLSIIIQRSVQEGVNFKLRSGLNSPSASFRKNF